ncbi:hypothetical protein [Nocardia lijiangensis]|uniref:hypothetical protein n=1 Tax=Nocardia lijiangensis TaxID=299618 RepID=UPI0012DD6D27|nr:hypothetical protein [Nocardia lijiangensis]
MDNAHEVLRRIAADGGLVEVVAHGTSWSDWNTLVHRLRSEGFGTRLTREGDEIALEVTSNIFSESSDISYTLTVEIGRQIWTSAFFEQSSIDLQCDGATIRTIDDLGNVYRLMKVMWEVARTRVILVPETIYPELVQPWIVIEAP